MTMKKVVINSLCFLGVWKKNQMSCLFCIYFFFPHFFLFFSWMVPIVVAHMLLHCQFHCQCYCLVQDTFVIRLSINGLMCCSLVGKEGTREQGGKAGPSK